MSDKMRIVHVRCTCPRTIVLNFHLKVRTFHLSEQAITNIVLSWLVQIGPTSRGLVHWLVYAWFGPIYLISSWTLLLAFDWIIAKKQICSYVESAWSTEPWWKEFFHVERKHDFQETCAINQGNKKRKTIMRRAIRWKSICLMAQIGSLQSGNNFLRDNPFQSTQWSWTDVSVDILIAGKEI